MPKILKSKGHDRHAPYARNEDPQPVPTQAEKMLPVLNHGSIMVRIHQIDVDLIRLKLERDGLVQALNITDEQEDWPKAPDETTNEKGELQRKLRESRASEKLWREENDKNLRTLKTLEKDHEALLALYADKKKELEQVRLFVQSKTNRLEETIEEQAKELQSLKNKSSNT
ncbi:hypothetical protein FSARC_11217 [Fusarium sarcochroum]|uniref:Uncharacterized protein n=1 Tax=Fusarium sarcochroum TaxID=1208366 RepID=A0A8H4X1P7_9HYPO|nr:hypothetical protein FSARC_11217 [Fusarium sarcochroum]